VAGGNKRIIIRPLRERELDDMVRLWKVAGLSYKPRGRDRMALLEAQRRRHPELFIGAFAGRELVGAAIASDDGRKAWINRLAVHPDHRRSGLALAMIDHCERLFRRSGRGIFCVHIEKGNSASMRLFRKAGYHREHDIFYYTKRVSEDY